MATVHVHRAHRLGIDAARERVEKIALDMKHQLDIDYRWQDDELLFHRTGADGRIRVSDTEVDVLVELGFILSAMKSTIKVQIERYLDQNF